MERNLRRTGSRQPRRFDTANPETHFHNFSNMKNRTYSKKAAVFALLIATMAQSLFFFPIPASAATAKTPAQPTFSEYPARNDAAVKSYEMKLLGKNKRDISDKWISDFAKKNTTAIKKIINVGVENRYKATDVQVFNLSKNLLNASALSDSAPNRIGNTYISEPAGETSWYDKKSFERALKFENGLLLLRYNIFQKKLKPGDAYAAKEFARLVKEYSFLNSTGSHNKNSGIYYDNMLLAF